jgi:uncharacterized protein involved in exopolysaccharide biosynthesis
VRPDIDADSTPGPASPPVNGPNPDDPPVIRPQGNKPRPNDPPVIRPQGNKPWPNDPPVVRPQANGLRPNDAAIGDPNLTDLVGVLHRRRWWIAAIVALAAVVGYGLGSRSPLESRADTRLLLVEPSEEGTVLPASDPLPLEERQSAVVSRAESHVVRAEVAEALGLKPGDIKSVSADAAEGESFVTIAVTTVDGVDTAAITDRIAASVVEQQREAVGARSNALAGELRRAAKDTNAEIAAIDAQLEQLSRDMAVLKLDAGRKTGTDASVDPQVALAVKTDMATGLRSSRAALVSTQADFEHRAKEADVAGAVSSGGLEVYEPAGTAGTTRTLPPVQLSVLAASLALVVLVCAAYFVAYRTEAPRGTRAPTTEHGWDGRTAARVPPQDDHQPGDWQDAAADVERI